MDVNLRFFQGKGIRLVSIIRRHVVLGILHFYVEDMEKVIEELHEKGIETEPIREDPFTEKRMTFFHDPDGLPLELHE